MTKEQYDNWTKFRSSKGNPTSKEAKMIAKYYAEIFNMKYWLPCSCNGKKYQQWIDELNKHYVKIGKPTE